MQTLSPVKNQNNFFLAKLTPSVTYFKYVYVLEFWVIEAKILLSLESLKTRCYNHFHKFLRFFGCFIKFPFHHKWSDVWLLLINDSLRYPLNDCRYNMGHTPQNAFTQQQVWFPLFCLISLLSCWIPSQCGARSNDTQNWVYSKLSKQYYLKIPAKDFFVNSLHPRQAKFSIFWRRK